MSNPMRELLNDPTIRAALVEATQTALVTLVVWALCGMAVATWADRRAARMRRSGR